MEIKKDNQISSNPKSPRAFDDLNIYEQHGYIHPSAIVVSYGCAIDYIIVEYPGGALPKHGHAAGGEFVERLSFNPGEYITGIEAETGIYKENGILYSIKFNTSQNRQLGVQAKPSGFYTKIGEQKIVLEKGEAVACFYGSTARANNDHFSDCYLSALGIYTRCYVDTFALNDYCIGFSEKKDNCWNYSIIAKDPAVDIFRNEYYAGFIQGKLQGADTIIAARNNVWNNAYLTDTSAPEDKFPHDFDPTEEELEKAASCLLQNYKWLYKWITKNEESPVATNIKRLLLRLLGISDGITYKEPQKDANFEKINPETMNPLKLQLRYRIQQPSFMDLYLINAQSDLFDAISFSKESHRGIYKADRCSAFVKRTTDEKGNKDICWTHNTWSGFLCQSLTISYAIGNDFITQNSYCQGQVGSNMDFGFNGHGICFNETTHRNSCIHPKAEGIWMCWRAAAAEMFAKSIDEFYDYISVDNTSTYLNGYMLIDVNTNETALIEMSYDRFVLFKSDGGEYTVEDSVYGLMGKHSYDNNLLTPDYILGINYPISYQVARDLASTDNRPMRRIQFKDQINTVGGMDSAKALITYVGKDAEGKEEPLSIFGRWDLGYGTTEYPKTIPDGAVDAKVFSANAVRALLSDMKFIPNKDSAKSSFWMLYGTPVIDGKPFIWSESQWSVYKKKQDKDLVPDRLEGTWNETKLFMD